MYRLCFLVIGIWCTLSVNAQNPNILRIKVTDEQKHPIFGVYVAQLQKAILLTTSDMNGECLLNDLMLHNSDTLQFQGLGYAARKITVASLRHSPIVCLKELKYDLNEAQVQNINPKHLLKSVCEKLKKQKVAKIPVCRYFGPAQYEKITQCRDTVVELRREYGVYFTSGNVIPYNIWDKTFRSYLVPKYMARSYNLTLNGMDTLVPLYLTSDESRLDVGTRKVFTLQRAVQLYGPLFNDLKYYEIHPIDTDSSKYIFSFKTLNKAYPDKIRISCKGTFCIDLKKQCVTQMDFDYIDYQLLRQILLSNRKVTASPFSTKASLTFEQDSNGQNYIQFCHQITTWKHNLGEEYILIEQPSRDFPGENSLIEEEAFYCYNYQRVKPELQTTKILTQIHLAHRYPTGNYNPEVFQQLPSLLDTQKAYKDLSRFMNPEDQFFIHSDKPYYPENYILGSDIDDKEKSIYHQNLSATRKRLFELFNIPFASKPELRRHLHPNK